VEESHSYASGILLKAATLESETTAATLGAEGVRNASPMANMDFVSYPLGEYTENNLKFVEGMKKEPKVFSTNYFMLSPEGKFMTSKLAKKVWLHWAEGRVYGEYEGLATPTGYEYLFTFRCTKWIEKLERTKAFFTKMDANIPQHIFDAGCQHPSAHLRCLGQSSLGYRRCQR